jgi:hypothetical protein
VTLRVNGRTVVANNGIERWLEKNHRTWRAPGFVGAARFGPAVPVWFDLREDDLRIYGGDDQGDVNPFDARDAIVRGYVPGPGAVDEAPTTGGRRHGGRLTKGGDKATLKYRIETLETSVPPPPPPPTAPDLLITALDSTSFTVKNQGNAAAGPFTVRVNSSLLVPFGGLAAGASATYAYGSGCGSVMTVFADTYNDVIESDEANNVMTQDFSIC